MKKFIGLFLILIFVGRGICVNAQSRSTDKFNNDWKFFLGDEPALTDNSFNLISFTTKGEVNVVATDNGLQTNMESFQSSQQKAFNGLCIAVVQSNTIKGRISITATAEGLVSSTIVVQAN